MINKVKLKETARLNDMTLKDIAKKLDMNYQVFLRHIRNNTLRISAVNELMSILEFTLYSPIEVFFDSFYDSTLND